MALNSPESIGRGSPITRRRFGTIAGGVFASIAFGDACRPAAEPRGADLGRLTARPIGDVKTAEGSQPPAGSRPNARALGLDSARDAILQLPANATGAPLPLVVLFHGAGGSGERLLQRFGSAGDTAGVAVLAPDSRGSTWDAIRGGFGRDVAFVDRALEQVFKTVAIDPARVAAGGFSDGATYALSLGLVNGDLFRRVVAFSPGFVVPVTPHGTPRFFVSHGTADPILPIDRCSRVIVPELRRRGYDVTFREFDGGHEVPAAVAAEGMAWVAAASPGAAGGSFDVLP